MALNNAQQQAVVHESGPLLIIAGAGTGKTTVITERIKYLIEHRDIQPHQFFIATYTQKAAEEMNARLSMVMPYGYMEPWMGTFHSLCDRLLRLEGLEIGLNPSFRIMTQSDQWLFMKQHLHELGLKYYRPLGNPNKFISSLIKFFSRLQDENVAPVEFNALIIKKEVTTATEEQIELERLRELASAYQTYETIKRKESVMDYGDLIIYTLKLLRERPNIRSTYKKQFKHVLIDEFQDTNYAQFSLIKLLCPSEENPNLVVVGDDDQAIYKFRGASISNILEFKDIYPQAKEIVLTDNYRSTQAILDSAYASIIHNNPNRLETRLGLNKKLTSQQDKNSVANPRVLTFSTTEEEADWTAQEIRRLVMNNNLMYQDIAILARANSHLEPYLVSLKNYAIPYQLIANHGLFDQPEIRDLLCLLQVLVDPTNSLALFPLTQNPLFNLPPSLMFESFSQAKKNSTSLWEVIKQHSDPEVQKLVELVSLYQQKAAATTVTRLLYEFVLDTGYVDQFINTESLENQLKIKNLNLFLDKLKQFESVNQDKSVLNFLNTLDLWLEAGEDPGQAQVEDVDTVKVMTVHAAKGLEFSAVFVGSLVSGRFPSFSRRDQIEVPDELVKETIPQGNIHLQEERRLFYVALTRAKKYLYLTHALNVGGVRKRVMSGFVTETNLPVENGSEIIETLVTEKQIRHQPKATYLEGGKYKITSLSYSQLTTFQKCPLRYKYRYLLKIPAKPHHSATYGQSIHATLEQFHRLEMLGQTPSKDDLLAIYKEQFINEGYESSLQRAERFDAGKEALITYLDHYKSILHKPVMLEQRFRVNLGGVFLIGKIDRIDEVDGSFEIIDYKTGSPTNQKKADKNEQLSLYAIAAREALKLDVSKLSLLYLEPEMVKVTSTRSDGQLVQTKQKLMEEIEKMKASEFPAKPNEHICSFCEYKRLCPFVKK